jgi:hypothetical protein
MMEGPTFVKGAGPKPRAGLGTLPAGRRGFVGKVARIVDALNRSGACWSPRC